MVKATSQSPSGRYNANYGNFQRELYAEIRREAFGEDIGQNSWLTSDEQDKFLEWLNLNPEKILLDVACGSWRASAAYLLRSAGVFRNHRRTVVW